MSHPGHEIVKCKCGKIIRQCRCMEKDKTVRELPWCRCAVPETTPEPATANMMKPSTPPSDPRVASSSRKHYYGMLYANGYIGARELLDLRHGLERRLEACRWADMTFGEKCFARFGELLVAALGRGK